MARPKTFTDETRLCVQTTGVTKLQPNGARRAIVNAMIDAGGCMTLKELDDHFKFSVRNKALALIRAGWLAEVCIIKE